MAEVLFYHMTESRLDDTLPGLLERSLARGWRAVVQTLTQERRDALDHHLWVFSDASFLPHATDADAAAASQGSAAHQPILLTVRPDQIGADPSGFAANVRFLVEGAVPNSIEPHERGVYLFDGHDEEHLQIARTRWKVEKAAGHDVTYWQQSEDRRWIKKA